MSTTGRSTPTPPYRLPDPLRCRGHVDVLDAEGGQGIENGIHDCSERWRNPTFATAFDAQVIAGFLPPEKFHGRAALVQCGFARR